MVKEKTFVIYRKGAGRNEQPTYERYNIPLVTGMTILEALFYIQDHYDHTLAFRYSCRGAICGSCGLTINKYPQLACKTQIEPYVEKKHPNLSNLSFGIMSNWNPKKEVLIEPLPNMTVIKDLIVDMEPFWKFYREVKPFLIER